MIFGLEKNTKVVVQGITGHQGRVHAQLMRSFGTNIVAGVVPGKGGGDVDDIPVLDTMHEAVQMTNAEASVLFVPAAKCLDASLEALDAGIRLLVIVTEHMPKHDAVLLREEARKKRVNIIGPNCPGIGIPGICKLGIMPNQIFSPGNVGVISRSGTLTYEIVQGLTDAGIGQRCCIGIGGDSIPGTTMSEAAMEFRADLSIGPVVLIGEIGGIAEIGAARSLAADISRPVVAFLAGRSAPPGKRMGHAGAVLSKGAPGIGEKEEILRELGVHVCRHMGDIPPLLRGMMDTRNHR